MHVAFLSSVHVVWIEPTKQKEAHQKQQAQGWSKHEQMDTKKNSRGQQEETLDAHAGVKTIWHRREEGQRLNTLGRGRQRGTGATH